MKKDFKAQFPLESIETFIHERQIIDGSELAERERSITLNGVVTPLIIRKMDDKTFMLIGGYMRYLACRNIGRVHVPANIYSKITDLEALDIAIIDNIQHSEMSDWDIATMLQKYRDQDMKLEEIATRITKSPSYVSLKLKVLSDSLNLQKAVESDQVTEQQARYVRQLPEQVHEEAIREVAGKTVRETKTTVERLAGENEVLMLEDEIKDYENKLTEIEGHEKAKEKLTDEISKLEGELKATTIENKELNGIMRTVETLENDYFPVEREIALYTSELTETRKLLPDYDVEELTKDRSTIDTQVAKAQKKVAKIQGQLKDARKAVKTLQESRKTVTGKISEYNTRTRKVRELTKLTDKLKEKKQKLDAKLGDKVKAYEQLKATLKENEQTVLADRLTLMDKISTMKTSVYSLTGKVNNRKTYEKRIAEIRTEITALTAQDAEVETVQVESED